MKTEYLDWTVREMNSRKKEFIYRERELPMSKTNDGDETDIYASHNDHHDDKKRTVDGKTNCRQKTEFGLIYQNKKK